MDSLLLLLWSPNCLMGSYIYCSILSFTLTSHITLGLWQTRHCDYMTLMLWLIDLDLGYVMGSSWHHRWSRTLFFLLLIVLDLWLLLKEVPFSLFVLWCRIIWPCVIESLPCEDVKPFNDFPRNSKGFQFTLKFGFPNCVVCTLEVWWTYSTYNFTPLFLEGRL